MRLSLTAHCRALAALLAVLALGGCQMPFSAGGCSHTYRDPLIVLAAATDARTGATLPRVSVRDVTFGGQPASLESLLLGPTRNVVLAPGELVCGADCGFATSPGRYRFTVVAPGYQPLVIERDVDFARFQGGCPSYNAGSYVLRVQLTAEPAAT